ncbi:hypothetical protein [Xanthobacter autotrophicus]
MGVFLEPFSNLPAGASLKKLAAAIKARWACVPAVRTSGSPPSA